MRNKYSKQLFLFMIACSISLTPAFSQSTVVESIYFKSNSFSIDKRYLPTLNLLAAKLSSDSFGYLKIFGFADRKGPAGYNDDLSEKRAEAVYNYLFAHATFDTTRVYVTSIGESGETYDLHFPGAHKQSRCADILIQFYTNKKIKPK